MGTLLLILTVTVDFLLQLGQPAQNHWVLQMSQQKASIINQLMNPFLKLHP